MCRAPSCADCLEIWEPQPPRTLRACPGLYKGYFTFTSYMAPVFAWWYSAEAEVSQVITDSIFTAQFPVTWLEDEDRNSSQMPVTQRSCLKNLTHSAKLPEYNGHNTDYHYHLTSHSTQPNSCLPSCSRGKSKQKGVWGSGGIALLILNLYTTVHLHAPVALPPISCCIVSWADVSRREKNLLPLLGIEPRFHGPVTIPTEPS